MQSINMNKTEIREFFNSLAKDWDKNNIIDEKIINIIFDNAEINENKKILDVGCGTGVLIPFYLKRNVKKITAIDFSKEMIDCAKRKHQNPLIDFVCADVETYEFEEKYDVIVLYNSFPHFINQEKLIEKLATLLNDGGILTVAHSVNRDEINKIHFNVQNVSLELMDINDLKKLFEQYLNVTKTISSNMYQIVGKKI